MTPDGPAGDVRAELQRLPVAEARRRIAARVQRSVADFLGLMEEDVAPDATFLDLGFDSLRAVDFAGSLLEALLATLRWCTSACWSSASDRSTLPPWPVDFSVGVFSARAPKRDATTATSRSTISRAATDCRRLRRLDAGARLHLSADSRQQEKPQ